MATTTRKLWADKKLLTEFYQQWQVAGLLAALRDELLTLLAGKRDAGTIDGGTP